MLVFHESVLCVLYACRAFISVSVSGKNVYSRVQYVFVFCGRCHSNIWLPPRASSGHPILSSLMTHCIFYIASRICSLTSSATRSNIRWRILRNFSTFWSLHSRHIYRAKAPALQHDRSFFGILPAVVFSFSLTPLSIMWLAEIKNLSLAKNQRSINISQQQNWLLAYIHISNPCENRQPPPSNALVVTDRIFGAIFDRNLLWISIVAVSSIDKVRPPIPTSQTRTQSIRMPSEHDKSRQKTSAVRECRIDTT